MPLNLFKYFFYLYKILFFNFLRKITSQHFHAMEGSQCINCVRSEIHNVLSTMRRNGRWASDERFVREIPLDFENPLIRQLKSLHEYLQPFEDIHDVDAVAYLQPFLDVVAFPNTNGAMTGRALSSINKFLLYGAITQESLRGREAINLAVASVVECKFEATNSYSDEVVLMQLLEVTVNLLRCPAGPFISDVNVWKMIETCYKLKTEKRTGQLLRNTAANSLTHLILTLFSRAGELITREAINEYAESKLNFDGPPDGFISTKNSTRARRQSREGEVFSDDDFDDDININMIENDILEQINSPTTGDQHSSMNACSSGGYVEDDETFQKLLKEQRANQGAGSALGTPSISRQMSNISGTGYNSLGNNSDMNNIEDPDEELFRILQPIRFGNPQHDKQVLEKRATSIKNGGYSSSNGGSRKVTKSYGLPILVKVLDFLSNLTDPNCNDDHSLGFALQLINIVLESGGEALGGGIDGGEEFRSSRNSSNTPHPQVNKIISPIVQVLSGEMCKHLLHNSQSLDLDTLSLTLRVVFNLFNAMKGHLKVQLEVFLVSVHIRIAKSNSATFEQKELALESLLDFCREPALIFDLYTNYDCDFHCTNLFEKLCKCLCYCSVPISIKDNTICDVMAESQYQYDDDPISSEAFSSSLDHIMSLSNHNDKNTGDGIPGITVLEGLSLEGILSVIDAIASRCDSKNSNKNALSNPYSKKSNINNDSNCISTDEGVESNKSKANISSGNAVSELKSAVIDAVVSNAADDNNMNNWENIAADDLDSRTINETVDEEMLWFANARERAAEILRERKRTKRRLLLAARQFNKQPHKQYWLDYTQDLGILPSPATPADVATFFLNTPGLDKTAVGDYISEDPSRKPFNHEVMNAYIESFQFTDVRIDNALRMLLESFRLPGEAQKVDRLMECFGQQYYLQNKIDKSREDNNDDDKKENTDKIEKETTDSISSITNLHGGVSPLTIPTFLDGSKNTRGIFKSADASFIFAFSIIMLHTDLHNKGIAPEKKMKEEEFVRNNRAINDGEDLPKELLVSIYKDIKNDEMRMLYDPHASEGTEIDFSHNNINAANEDQVPGGNRLSGGGPTWEKVLRHSQLVDKAAFTPKSFGRLNFFPAGVHERDMYLIIFDNSMQAISVIFEMTRDGKMAARALEGFRNLGKIAVHFNLKVHFNRVMITLCKYVSKFLPALIEGGQTEDDIEGLSALRNATILAATNKSKNKSLTSNKVKLAIALARAERYAALATCRALLTFRALLSLCKQFGSSMQESWRNFIQILLFMHEADLLPSSFVELDDVYDPNTASKGNQSNLSSSTTNSFSSDNLSSSTLITENNQNQLTVETTLNSYEKQENKSVNKPFLVKNNESPTSVNDNGGFFSTLSSFIWSDNNQVDEAKLISDDLVREILTACNLDTIFTKSKSLSEESFCCLLDALLVPLEEPEQNLAPNRFNGNGDDENTTTIFERNTILCIELITNVAIANQDRISKFWPILRRAYRQVLINAHTMPEGDDDDDIYGNELIIDDDKDHGTNRDNSNNDNNNVQNSGSVQNENEAENMNKKYKNQRLLEGRPSRMRRVGNCSILAVERVVISLLRISVRLLDEESVSLSLLGALSWLGEFSDDICNHLAFRIGSSLSTVLNFHAGNIKTTLGWRMLGRLIRRYSMFQGSVDAMWEIIQSIVSNGNVDRINMNEVIETITIFIRLDDKAALPPSLPPTPASAHNNSRNEWANVRASTAVTLFYDLSNQVFSNTEPKQWGGPAVKKGQRNNFNENITNENSKNNFESNVQHEQDSINKERRYSSELDSMGEGEELVQAMLPDQYQCWMMLVIQIRSWFGDPRPEVAASALKCLQNEMWSPPKEIENPRWVEIFEQILFPLMEQSLGTNSNNQIAIRAINLLTKTFLHNLVDLSTIPELHMLWLRMITFMSRGLTQEGIVKETVLENLKNIIMVMQGEGTFKNTEHAGQNVWELTWTVIESQAPGIRQLFELHSPTKSSNVSKFSDTLVGTSSSPSTLIQNASQMALDPNKSTLEQHHQSQNTNDQVDPTVI